MCTSHIQSFYELIPEFFTCPEFLVNYDHYDLGTGDNGDVKLPQWAKTPFEFVYLNRKALESDIVSNHLHEWIDLIWGIRQNGEKAVESNNVFDSAMYETSWNKINENDMSCLPLKIHTETTGAFMQQKLQKAVLLLLRFSRNHEFRKRKNGSCSDCGIF